jgi:hypothetical protein
MVKHPDVNQLQSRLQLLGDVYVSITGFGHTRWVIVGKNNRSSIVKQGRLNDFPWVNAGAIDCAPKQLIATDDAMLVIQKYH